MSLADLVLVIFVITPLSLAVGKALWRVIAFLYAAFWGDAADERARVEQAERREREKAERAAEFLARIDEAFIADDFGGYAKHVRELRRAGYNAPDRPTDERWGALRDLVIADLGKRWTQDKLVGRIPAITEAVGWHARGLRRLNRIRLGRLSQGRGP